MVHSYHLKFLDMWDHISQHVSPQLQSFDAHVAARPSGAQQSHIDYKHYCSPPKTFHQCGTETPANSEASFAVCRPIRETTSEALHWDRSPIRRRHHKRRPNKAYRSSTNSIFAPLKYLLVTSCALHYYTSDTRSTFLIIMMDSLIVTCTSKVLMGFALTYLQSLQDRLNKLQHIITGNPRLLLLDQLIPDQRQTISLENLLQEHDETITHSRDYLLSCRPPKETSEAPLLPLANNRLLLPRRRKGRRVQILTASQDRIFAKTQNKSKNRIKRQPSSLTTPHKTRNRRDKGIQVTHRINFEASKPAPPPRGAPGAAPAANEEFSPQPLKSSSLSGLCARVLRRRLYRQWRSACRESIRPLRLGKVVANKGKPRRAASQPSGKQNARLFRHLVLTQGLDRRVPKGKKSANHWLRLS